MIDKGKRLFRKQGFGFVAESMTTKEYFRHTRKTEDSLPSRKGTPRGMDQERAGVG